MSSEYYGLRDRRKKNFVALFSVGLDSFYFRSELFFVDYVGVSFCSYVLIIASDLLHDATMVIILTIL